MPVIGIPTHSLQRLLKTKMDSESLIHKLEEMGCDVEGITDLRRFQCQKCEFITEITQTEDPPNVCDQCNADYTNDPELRKEIDPIQVIRMELLAVRPDMFDAGGLSRALRGYLSIEKGLKEYPFAPPNTSCKVDKSVSHKDSYRPYIVCAILRNITLDDDIIKMIMKLQENLHWALGRNRKLASIGVYDLDTVDTSGFIYRAVGPQELTFVPLGYDETDPKAKITPQQILEEHPKGVAFAHLLEGWKKYPLLTDINGKVLSMPPIINSEYTRLTKESKNFYIDVTGPGLRLISRALNILVTSLLEVQPEITIEQVRIEYPDGTVRITPDYTYQEMELSCKETNKLLGIPLKEDEIVDNLLRMRHNAKRTGDSIAVSIAPYRNDILHPRDLMEDVAIAFGYHNIVPLALENQTYGNELSTTTISHQVQELMIGLGYLEITTLMLTSPQISYTRLRREVPDNFVQTLNPVSVEQSILRTDLMAALLETFSLNVNQEMPQRLFEIGDVSRLDESAETYSKEHLNLCAGVMGPKADYAEIQSVFEALMMDLGAQIQYVPLKDHPYFIPGRGAKAIVHIEGKEVLNAIIGEIHPEILEQFSIIQPIAAFETTLNGLLP